MNDKKRSPGERLLVIVRCGMRDKHQGKRPWLGEVFEWHGSGAHQVFLDWIAPYRWDEAAERIKATPAISELFPAAAGSRRKSGMHKHGCLVEGEHHFPDSPGNVSIEQFGDAIPMWCQSCGQVDLVVSDLRAKMKASRKRPWKTQTVLATRRQ